VSTLDNFRREARRWLKAIRAGDADAIGRLHRAHARAPELPALRDVQHAVAREHGYENWQALRTALDHKTSHAPAAGAGLTHAERVATFLEAACPDCNVRGPSSRSMHLHAAMRLITRHPDIAAANFFTSVVCGDLEGVQRLLDAQPGLASEPGGPRAWPPLLYLCNARLDVAAAQENAVAIARTLLDRDADPNARYILHGVEDYPYSALASVLGRGEEEAQTHARAEPLARLLLERGAEPYDRQLLYNVFADNSSRGLLGDDLVWLLDLIYTHSLQRGRKADWDNPDWPMLDPWGRGHGAGFLLDAAMDGNHPTLTTWLHAHGARPDPARVRQRPSEEDGPANLLMAVQHDRSDIVELLLDRGMSADHDFADLGHSRPLHHAAGADAVGVIELLIARGAEVDPRESNWNATPLGFAIFGERRRAIEALARISRDVFNLTFAGKVERLRELFDEEPALAKGVKTNGATPLMWLPDDEPRAIEIIDLFLAHGADPAARTVDGKTAVDWALERGLDIAAARLGATRS
jgi:ankyrin repeat protein